MRWFALVWFLNAFIAGVEFGDGKGYPCRKPSFIGWINLFTAVFGAVVIFLAIKGL